MTAAAIIFFSSDSATQHLMDSEDYDFTRALSGAAFGIIATSWLHYWWGFLETVIGAQIPVARHRLANTLVKVLIDQGVGAPLYIFSYYIVTNSIQKLGAEPGRKVTDILIETEERARHMLWPTMMTHWKIWPCVHSINFYFVPLQHRVLVQNTALVGWSGCKSYFSILVLGLVGFPSQAQHGLLFLSFADHTDLSHLNKTGIPSNEGKLMTPKEEIETTIQRRRTLKGPG